MVVITSSAFLGRAVAIAVVVVVRFFLNFLKLEFKKSLLSWVGRNDNDDDDDDDEDVDDKDDEEEHE